MSWCVFCAIVHREEPATIHYETEEIIVFENNLRWTPVMLLVTPKPHVSQAEMWRSWMDRVAPLAVRLGQELCPKGFRLLSNLGSDAMQSQDHGHLHILGGRHLGHYVY